MENSESCMIFSKKPDPTIEKAPKKRKISHKSQWFYYILRKYEVNPARALFRLLDFLEFFPQI
jgi:hypothetical protein